MKQFLDAWPKKMARVDAEEIPMASRTALERNEPEDDALEHPHVRQVIDLLTWHIGVEDAR